VLKSHVHAAQQLMILTNLKLPSNCLLCDTIQLTVISACCRPNHG